MIRDMGYVEPGTTLYIPFHTFDSNDPSASVTLTGLATTDIEIYKDGSTTQRASDSGYALLDTDGIDFDTITGIHGISINLADNTTAGFYAAGSQYWVVISSVTVDAATINFVLCTFRIGYAAAHLNTTIATLSTQTSFTLTNGPAEDDALNGSVVLIHDVASAVQKGYAVVSDYTGSSKTVTLLAGTTFTAAATDNIAFFPPVNMTHIANAAVGTSTAQIGVNVVNAGGTAWASGSLTSGVFASGAITATAIAADAIGASELAADAVTEIQSGLATASALSTVDTNVSSILAAVRAVAGTSDSGSTTTMVDAARTEADDDYWNGAIILFTSGTIAGQARVITDFVAATDTITFAPATTQAVSTQNYVIIPAGDFLRPTTSGRTLDVSAGGEAGVDWANVGTPGSTVNLSATTVNLTNTVTTYTGNTPQTGDAFARLGAPAGASVSADILVIDNLVDDLESRLGTPSNLGGGATIAANLVDIESQTDDIGAAGAGLTAIPWNASWDAEVQSEVDDALVARSLDKLVIVSGTADSGSTTTMVDAARTEADADYWKGKMLLFTSGNISGQTAIITDFNAGTDTFTFAPATTQAVSTQTYVILPAISVWDDTLAEHLTAGSTGAALNAAGSAGDPWNTALPGAYGAGTAGKIVGDNINATISSRSSHSAADVWAVATRVLTAGTNIVLAKGTGVTGFNDLSAAQVNTEVDTALADIHLDHLIGVADPGSIVANNSLWAKLHASGITATYTDYNHQSSSLMAISSYAQSLDEVDLPNVLSRLPAALVSGRMDSSVGAMAANTLTASALATDAVTEIQTGLSTLDAAGVRTAVGLATANLDTQLTAIDDYLDTEVAAIKAKTDNLPSDPADQSAVEAAITAAWTTALTEAYAADGATATPAQLLYMILSCVAEFSISGTTLTCKKLDGSTTAMTYTLNDATNPTSRTRAS